MLHRCYANPQGANADRLHAIADSLTLDDSRTEAILRDHLKLDDDRWTQHRYTDLFFSADDALACGFATEISEWSPPPGVPIFAV